MSVSSSEPSLPLAQPIPHADDTLTVRFLAEGAQSAVEIAEEMAAFIDGAGSSLDLAIYDCRLIESTVAPIRRALASRLRAGVTIRLAYDPGQEKPKNHAEL